MQVPKPPSRQLSERPLYRNGHVVAQFRRSLQCSLDPDNLHLAGRDLPGRFAVTSRSQQAALVAGKHTPKDRHRTFLRLRMRTAEADQSLQAMLSGGQSAEVSSHIAQVAARRKGSPFFGSRILQSVFAVVGVIKTANGLAILLDELTGVELGVDHHGVGRGMAEQRLNVCGRVVVQMFGRKDAPAIVRQQHKRRAVQAAGFRVNRDPADRAANGLNASSAGMTDALDQIWRWRARTFLLQVPMVANRNRLAVVKAFDVSNDLRQDSAKLVADGDDT